MLNEAWRRQTNCRRVERVEETTAIFRKRMFQDLFRPNVAILQISREKNRFERQLFMGAYLLRNELVSSFCERTAEEMDCVFFSDSKFPRNRDHFANSDQVFRNVFSRNFSNPLESDQRRAHPKNLCGIIVGIRRLCEKIRAQERTNDVLANGQSKHVCHFVFFESASTSARQRNLHFFERGRKVDSEGEWFETVAFVRGQSLLPCRLSNDVRKRNRACRSFRLNHSGIDVVRTAPFADVFRDELEAELFRDDGIFGPRRCGGEGEEGKKEGDAFHGVAGVVGIVHQLSMSINRQCHQ